MSYVPRSHYLTLHDALRKLLGPDAQLAAFVKAKKNFQCDMLVNSARTDPLNLYKDGVRVLHNSSGASSSSSSSSHNYSKKGVELFAKQLQELLGLCDVVPHTHRLDVVFRDRNILQVALGANKADLPYPLEQGSDVNREPDWRKRNRLRISLGFDEDLFFSACTRSVNVAARVVERSMYDFCRNSAILSVYPRMQRVFEESGENWQAVLPPVTYWQAHGYALEQEYGCRHYRGIAATVEHVFAEYYGEFPMLNPYCAGEDLNTMEVVQWLCEARKTGALLTMGLDDATVEKMVMELQLDGGAADMQPEPEK